MKHSRSNLFWNILFWLYATALFVVIFLAYHGIIPLRITGIPNYDLYLHFSLMGMLAFLGHRALNRRYTGLFRFAVPLAPFLVSLFSVAEEFLQLLSAMRIFEFSDMMANLGGVWCFYLLDRLWQVLTENRRHLT